MRLYNDYNSYLKERYGTKVHRISIDAGFTCPNRDGTKGLGGCIYCDELGSRAPYLTPGSTVAKQLGERIDLLKAKGIKKFIAYFQPFSNTYAPVEKLKKIYDQVLDFKEIVGVSIGTRPDTIDPEKLKLIASYKNRYDIWMEFGLQSSHDKTLKNINRCHTYKDFVDAVKISKEVGLLVAVHVILGLPGETRRDMLETADRLRELKIEGLKIHPLHVLKNSALETMWKNNKVRLLELEEYAGLVCDFLEHMDPKTIIERLTGQGSKENHCAPEWALKKTETIKRIESIFLERGTRQGSYKGQDYR